MKLATIRTADGTRAVRVDAERLVDLGAADVGELLARNDWAATARTASGTTFPIDGATYATLIPHPSKVLCVGMNHKNHIEEMGRSMPDHPTLFPKFADALIGASDPINRPAETEAFDWECELVVVIGRPVRRATEAEAAAAIAGFTIGNDVTCRDWQSRTREWTQGKNWDSTTPIGPVLVTPDELPGGVRPACRISSRVNGELMQDDDTADLLFDPVTLVRYVSTIIRLNPGDLILTGTPGGVGHARKPPVYLHVGDVVEISVAGIGTLRNQVVAG